MLDSSFKSSLPTLPISFSSKAFVASNASQGFRGLERKRWPCCIRNGSLSPFQTLRQDPVKNRNAFGDLVLRLLRKPRHKLDCPGLLDVDLHHLRGDPAAGGRLVSSESPLTIRSHEAPPALNEPRSMPLPILASRPTSLPPRACLIVWPEAGHSLWSGLKWPKAKVTTWRSCG